jgi:hypothetical protein
MDRDKSLRLLFHVAEKTAGFAPGPIAKPLFFGAPVSGKES